MALFGAGLRLTMSMSRIGPIHVATSATQIQSWNGIRKANNLANHLRKTSTKTVTGKGQGLALRHKLAKGVNEVGFQKVLDKRRATHPTTYCTNNRCDGSKLRLRHS